MTTCKIFTFVYFNIKLLSIKNIQDELSTLLFLFSRLLLSISQSTSSTLEPIKHCIRFTQLAFNSLGDALVAGDQHGNIFVFYLSRNT